MKKKIYSALLVLALALCLAACGKKTVTVTLTGYGDTPMQLNKAIQEAVGVSLVEAKEMMDNVPSVVAEDVTMEEAEEIKAILEDASGIVEIK